ncbi:UDP-N-acetylglucosamine transferase subunit ALG14 [Nakaseomyces bracarensis]|uniref:UDP-N-acetylglucosamine transferase subunit ALG14 n=1 Tax=Nakaseomyces bracarensis TaxID=273131 RepID=A0ABR4NPI4_9SACH
MCSTYALVASVVLVVSALYIGRLIAVIPILSFAQANQSKNEVFANNTNKDGIHLFVFLGSGGHTGEMLRLLHNYREFLLNPKNTLYVGYSDNDSLIRFQKFIDKNGLNAKNVHYYPFVKAREVGAGLVSSVFSILKTLLNGFVYVFEIKMRSWSHPHMTLLNGPGTCCIIAFWSKFLEWIFFIPIANNHSNIIYVESLARVASLSLTGKILNILADVFIVQWEELKTKKAPRAEYYGILV